MLENDGSQGNLARQQDFLLGPHHLLALASHPRHRREQQGHRRGDEQKRSHRELHLPRFASSIA